MKQFDPNALPPTNLVFLSSEFLFFLLKKPFAVEGLNHGLLTI